jgi:hypothetical protein
MTEYYLKALRCRLYGIDLAKQLAGWLTGKDLVSLDSYELAQLLWEINLPQQKNMDLLKLKQILQIKRDRATVWDQELCMAMLAIICSTHEFEIQDA